MKFILLSSILLPLLSLSQDITIKKDTTVNGIWIIPTSTVIRFENNSRIHGNGTIQGGIIDAATTQHIFDTTLTVRPYGVYGKDFSCAWFGAKVYPDAYNSIQKSINTCIENSIRNCFLPKGNYHIGLSLKIAYLYKGQYSAASVHFYGESEFWDNKTNIICDRDGWFALGIQVGKGTEIDHLTFTGKFQSPTTTGADYYNTPILSYGSPNLSYGIIVDYDGSLNSSGSTGCKFHDLLINNFQVGISISPNAITFNAEILSFENIHFGDMRIGFQSGQAQEKANEIRGLWAWGKVHTLIQIGKNGKFQGAGYIIDRLNVAGACIRLFDIQQTGWYSTSIRNVFAESIATIGSLTTGDSKNIPPLSISNSTFNFATISACGVQTLLTSNSKSIVLENCNFRYYGLTDPMLFSGIATFINSNFTGQVKNNTPGSIFTVYKQSPSYDATN